MTLLLLAMVLGGTPGLEIEPTGHVFTSAEGVEVALVHLRSPGPKRALVRICLEAGWPFRRWTEFREIDAWLEEQLAVWKTDPGSVPAPAAHPFFCGPEAWGDGLFDPPRGAWPPAS